MFCRAVAHRFQLNVSTCNSGLLSQSFQHYESLIYKRGNFHLPNFAKPKIGEGRIAKKIATTVETMIPMATPRKIRARGHMLLIFLFEVLTEKKYVLSIPNFGSSHRKAEAYFINKKSKLDNYIFYDTYVK